MQVRALGNALAIALISIILMLGALSISLVEFVPEATPIATSTEPLSPMSVVATLTSQPTVTAESAITSLALESPTTTTTFTPTITATAPSSCLIPSGWGQMVVQPYDTLYSIAGRYRIDASQLSFANCLVSDVLMTGTVLYVPAVPTNTAVMCNQGMAGWAKNYSVRSGDTFYSISTSYGVSAALMKSVNCHTGSDIIYTGEVLWVPIINATRTPLPSFTPKPGDTAVPYPTDPLTETALPYTVTSVPSPVPNTPTPIPTYTLAPTLTASPTVFP